MSKLKWRKVTCGNSFDYEAEAGGVRFTIWRAKNTMGLTAMKDGKPLCEPHGGGIRWFGTKRVCVQEAERILAKYGSAAQ